MFTRSSQVAADNPQVVADLKAELQKVVDYQAVDAKAKANDYATYKRYFGGLRRNQLRRKLQDAYTGFDDQDYKKILRWEQLSEKAFYTR